MMKLAVCALLCAAMALSDAGLTPSCPSGWTKVGTRCFKYVPKPMTWADAEKNCQFMNGHLASVHSAQEYQSIQKVILDQSKASGSTWIGGSDAEQVFTWFWSDGSPFNYVNWHAGEPDNAAGNQRCIWMNYADNKTWDDLDCATLVPSICARNIA